MDPDHWREHILGYVDRADAPRTRSRTSAVRNGEWPGFQNFSFRLSQQGFSLESCWIIESFSEDTGEYMIVLAPNHQVIECIFDCNARHRPDPAVTDRDEGGFEEWAVHDFAKSARAREKIDGLIVRITE